MKVVLLNSGGKDTLASALLLKRYSNIVFPEVYDPIEISSIYVDMGWRNAERAKAAAQVLADAYCASHEIIKLEGSWQRPRDPNHASGVYHQNVTLHVLGGMYAAKNDIPYVVSGVQSGPVSSPSNLADILSNLYTVAACWEPARKIPKFVFPAAYLTRDNLLYLLADAPQVAQTVSCNEEQACGSCRKCAYQAMLWYRLGLGPEPTWAPQNIRDAFNMAVPAPIPPDLLSKKAFAERPVAMTPVTAPDPVDPIA